MWVQWLPWSIAESEECKMKKAVKNQPSIIGMALVILAMAAIPAQATVNYELWSVLRVSFTYSCINSRPEIKKPPPQQGAKAQSSAVPPSSS